MGKTETQDQPTAARPPRPEPRGRSEARAPGAGPEGVPGAYSAFRLAPNTTGEVSGVDVARVPAAALHAASVAAPSLLKEPPGVPGGAEPFEPAITEGESFGQPRSNVLGGLPLASLEGPSMASLDLTPSPVPRVSLVHANGAVDVSLVPGPHVIGGRNLPTVAARHVLGPARRVATPAITLPPQSFSKRAESSVEGRLARKLKLAMRSSKREIVLGLSIGVGLSVVLAGLGLSYVDHQRSWQAHGGIETAQLTALPEPAGSTAAVGDVPQAPSATPGSIHPEPVGKASVEPKPAEPGARERGGLAVAANRRVEPASAVEPKPEAPTPKPRASRNQPRQVPKRAASRRVDAPPSGHPPVPEKTSLSPSESAGLGLDLPL